jgi:hypothetical protein
MDPPGEPLAIGFEGAQLRAYFFGVPGAGAPRSLPVVSCGYDSTIYESFFGQAATALRRGYHCLVFDGPGQGAALFEPGIPIRGRDTLRAQRYARTAEKPVESGLSAEATTGIRTGVHWLCCRSVVVASR